MDDSGMNTRIKSYLRIRPALSDAERREECFLARGSEANRVKVNAVKRAAEHAFDGVLFSDGSQSDVYESVRHVVNDFLSGINCTVMVYGQSGSGKTYTMLGKGFDDDSLRNRAGNDFPLEEEVMIDQDSEWGIVPRAVADIFSQIDKISKEDFYTATVYCSFMQIYNDKVYDLFAPEDKFNFKKRTKSDNLRIRERHRKSNTHKRPEIYVDGLKRYKVHTFAQTIRLLRKGMLRRTIRSTKYNEHSSRSHAILQLALEIEDASRGADVTIFRRSKLHLVDLAGSERWVDERKSQPRKSKNGSMTRAQQTVRASQIFCEHTKINKSLSALGNVIASLTDKGRSHIPFRDSQLTRILSDSLGGNTQTTLIATVGPSRASAEDTIATLRFAERAKHVKSHVTINEIVSDATLLKRARVKIAALQKKIDKKVNCANEELRAQCKDLRRKLGAAEAQAKNSRHRIHQLERQLLAERKKSDDKLSERAMTTALPKIGSDDADGTNRSSTDRGSPQGISRNRNRIGQKMKRVTKTSSVRSVSKKRGKGISNMRKVSSTSRSLTRSTNVEQREIVSLRRRLERQNRKIKAQESTIEKLKSCKMPRTRAAVPLHSPSRRPRKRDDKKPKLNVKSPKRTAERHGNMSGARKLSPIERHSRTTSSLDRLDAPLTAPVFGRTDSDYILQNALLDHRVSPIRHGALYSAVEERNRRTHVSAPKTMPVEYRLGAESAASSPGLLLNERHLQLLQTQTNCTRMQAIDAYRRHGGDIAEAVMELFSTQHAGLFDG